MKIIPGSYPEEANWPLWISFTKGPEINLVFLYRLAAYVRDVVGKPVSMYGFRTYAEQVAAYDDYLAGGNIAAKPGTSWHGFGLAVDFNRIATVAGKGDYPGTLDEDYALFAAGRSELMAKYGIIHTVKTEPWHIQPIETRGYTGDRSRFLDADDYMNGEDNKVLKIGDLGQAVYDYQLALKTIGYDFGDAGDMHDDAVRNGLTGEFDARLVDVTTHFQANHGLYESGQADAATYGRLMAELVNAVGSGGIPQADYDAVMRSVEELTGQLTTQIGICANQAAALSTVTAERDQAQTRVVELDKKLTDEQGLSGTLAEEINGREAEAVNLAKAIDTVRLFREKHIQ